MARGCRCRGGKQAESKRGNVLCNPTQQVRSQDEVRAKLFALEDRIQAQGPSSRVIVGAFMGALTPCCGSVNTVLITLSFSHKCTCAPTDRFVTEHRLDAANCPYTLDGEKWQKPAGKSYAWNSLRVCVCRCRLIHPQLVSHFSLQASARTSNSSSSSSQGILCGATRCRWQSRILTSG